jgi:hypothetical protein
VLVLPRLQARGEVLGDATGCGDDIHINMIARGAAGIAVA